MRTFGKDTPEFMVFQVEGDERTYKLPLAASLKPVYNMRILEAMREKDADELEYLSQKLMIDIFTDYLGPEFIASTTVSQMLEIWKAWNEENRKANQETGE